LEDDVGMDVFPGFSQLFQVIPDCDREFRGSLTSGNFLQVTRGEVEPDGVLTLRHRMGRSEPGLVVFPLSPFAFYLKQAVVSLLEDRGLTGWSSYPVMVIDEAGREYPDYAGLVVRGRCGRVSNRHSTAFKKQALRGNSASTWWRGISFDPSTWDGSDLFMPDANQGHILCTEPTRSAFIDAGVTQLDFEPMDEVELDFRF
jgi:hypothetical protein